MPGDEVGFALALADRLDMLFGVFVVDEAPTGTRDPLGIRRAAYGALDLIWDLNVLDIDIQELIERVAEGYPEFEDVEAVIPVVLGYLADRLRGFTPNEQFKKDEIEAVLAVGWHNPREMSARLKALHSFCQAPDGDALAESNKRIRNILRKTEAPAGEIVPDLLREPAEQALAERVAKLRPEVEKLCRERQYKQAMEKLAALAEPVAKFFDDVLVMAEEPEMRHNRLRLLRDVRELFLTIADLSRLQGGPKEAEAS